MMPCLRSYSFILNPNIDNNGIGPVPKEDDLEAAINDYNLKAYGLTFTIPTSL